MEKEKFFLNDTSPPSLSYRESSSPPNWQSSSTMDVQFGDLNCSSDQLTSCFLNLNWDNSIDQSAPFESELSSIVSSPVASNVPNESIVIRELIGKLGSICNSGEISPQSQRLGIGGNNNSTNTSCYSTPLNSPPKLNLSMMDHQARGNLPVWGNSMMNNTHHTLATFASDPGFAERAAKFSCFGSRNFNQFFFFLKR
ncbi:transcription factor bHLH62-like [Tasmannia lanceolata]|uniref:transcription factor bHLH62-like n=1 Tax=Tasmannia lanceolata TaxID=3420 RepID=UPI004062FFE1